jgi:hypothetical protein
MVLFRVASDRQPAIVLKGETLYSGMGCLEAVGDELLNLFKYLRSKLFNNNHLKTVRSSCSGGDLNPPLGFYFPLFSMSFAREFPSGWQSVEGSGIKIAVFFVVKLLTKFSCVLAIVCLPQ